MINGIVQLVNMSATGIQGTATAAATAIQTVEKASVILTIISAAMSIAMQIVNLFNNDDKKQEEIEALQDRIDQLQWELDNADIVRLQENSGKAVERVKRALSETYKELLRNKIAVNDVAGAWRLLFSNVSNNAALLQKTAEKLATAYANIAYTADKALGGEKYSNAQEQLKNLAHRTADAQHHSGGDARNGVRNHYLIYSLPLRRSQCQTGFTHSTRAVSHRIFRHRNDGGQRHNGKHNTARQPALTDRQVEDLLQKRHNDN